MPLSTNINTYHDVVQVLSTAREAGEPLRYTLPSRGAAVMFRARVFNFRSLLVKAAQAKQGNVVGFVPTTAWDDVSVELEPKPSTSVVVGFGKLAGTLTTLSGRIVQPAEVPIAPPARSEEIIAGLPARPKDEPLRLEGLEYEAVKLKKELGL